MNGNTPLNRSKSLFLNAIFYTVEKLLFIESLFFKR